MKLVERHGNVGVYDRNGKIYLMYFVAGKREREATGVELTGTKLPASVKQRVQEINDSFTAAKGKAALEKLGVHVPSPKEDGFTPIGMGAAMEKVISLADTQNDHYRENLRDYARYFKEFMKVKHPAPAAPYWHEITKTHVLEYIQAKKADGLSNKTIRGYVAPILATSDFYADLEPEHYRKITIKMKQLLPLEKKKVQCLSIDQALGLIPVVMKSKSDYCAPLLFLGSFAGLNVAEIQSLQKCDWDGKTGVLDVRRAKTINRPRIIPVLGLVRDWCDAAFGALENPDSHLITMPSGNPIAVDDYNTVTRAFRRRILKPAGITISPSDCCRETFINFMVKAGIDGDLRRAYAGHAERDSHTRHYADFDDVDVLREQVIKPLEKKHKKLSKLSTVHNAYTATAKALDK